jgi:hypothetical protein
MIERAMADRPLLAFVAEQWSRPTRNSHPTIRQPLYHVADKFTGHVFELF